MYEACATTPTGRASVCKHARQPHVFEVVRDDDAVERDHETNPKRHHGVARCVQRIQIEREPRPERDVQRHGHVGQLKDPVEGAALPISPGQPAVDVLDEIRADDIFAFFALEHARRRRLEWGARGRRLKRVEIGEGLDLARRRCCHECLAPRAPTSHTDGSTTGSRPGL